MQLIKKIVVTILLSALLVPVYADDTKSILENPEYKALMITAAVASAAVITALIVYGFSPDTKKDNEHIIRSAPAPIIVPADPVVPSPLHVVQPASPRVKQAVSPRAHTPVMGEEQDYVLKPRDMICLNDESDSDDEVDKFRRQRIREEVQEENPNSLTELDFDVDMDLLVAGLGEDTPRSQASEVEEQA